ncbi:hypothetical protein [Nostoc sp.]|uniref:hypothetical protein n=1 Tax=Nostoc sp. TaxID=1180 RepID=UPI002FF7EF11
MEYVAVLNCVEYWSQLYGQVNRLEYTGIPFVGLPTGYEKRYKPHIGLESENSLVKLHP